jgi:hypothetical protein
MRNSQVEHGPRRRVRDMFRRTCRWGLAAYPCLVEDVWRRGLTPPESPMTNAPTLVIPVDRPLMTPAAESRASEPS